MLIALTREVSPALARCELTHLDRVPIDVGRARRQHADYERALETLGCTVRRLAADDDMADAVFIEDAAVVVDELAIIARPGAMSRRVETAVVERALGAYRSLARIEPPGTLDGGDVLVVGRSMFVGKSARTNASAIEQVRALVAPFGYHVHAVDVHGCLHLKSAVTAVSEDRVLVNPAWIPREAFSPLERIEVDRGEPYGANVLRVGGSLVFPAAFPRTRERLERAGFPLTTVDVSELQKAEGAVTCCSLIFRPGAPGAS